MKGIAKLLLLAILPLSIGAGTSDSVVRNHSTIQTTRLLSVTETDVRNYLEVRDYYVVSAEPIIGTCYWLCETYKGGLHYATTVFTNCSIITGHEDVDL